MTLSQGVGFKSFPALLRHQNHQCLWPQKGKNRCRNKNSEIILLDTPQSCHMLSRKNDLIMWQSDVFKKDQEKRVVNDQIAIMPYFDSQDLKKNLIIENPGQLAAARTKITSRGHDSSVILNWSWAIGFFVIRFSALDTTSLMKQYEKLETAFHHLLWSKATTMKLSVKTVQPFEMPMQLVHANDVLYTWCVNCQI